MSVYRFRESLRQLGIAGPMHVKVGGVHIGLGPAISLHAARGLPGPARLAAWWELRGGAVELVPRDLLTAARIETVAGRHRSAIAERQPRPHGGHPGNGAHHACGIDAV